MNERKVHVGWEEWDHELFEVEILVRRVCQVKDEQSSFDQPKNFLKTHFIHLNDLNFSLR
jgi:hypothetical protein